MTTNDPLPLKKTNKQTSESNMDGGGGREEKDLDLRQLGLEGYQGLGHGSLPGQAVPVDS